MSKLGTERFAISILALSLIRAGFEVRDSVRVGAGIVDLVANRFEDDGSEIRFGVECKWIGSLNDLRREDYLAQAKALARNGLPMEVAVVVGDGVRIRVTPNLRKYMVFDASELTVEPLEAEEA